MSCFPLFYTTPKNLDNQISSLLKNFLFSKDLKKYVLTAIQISNKMVVNFPQSLFGFKAQEQSSKCGIPGLVRTIE